jgi:hypothetical protein
MVLDLMVVKEEVKLLEVRLEQVDMAEAVLLRLPALFYKAEKEPGVRALAVVLVTTVAEVDMEIVGLVQVRAPREDLVISTQIFFKQLITMTKVILAPRLLQLN